MSKSKKVIHIYSHGSKHWVGDGFPVRNLIPSSGLDRKIDPFLMLDYAGPADFEPSDKARGVGEHPHRGFETVTIAYRGSVEHRDSGGNSGIINPGDVQWMTAGSGVVHEEMHERQFTKQGGTFEMIQLWVNLPRIHKMTAPRYQTILSRDIPSVSLGDNNQARIIAGQIDGTSGPASTFTPITLVDLELVSGKSNIALSPTHNSAIFLLDGSVRVDDQIIDGDAKLALLDNIGDTLSLTAVKESRLLLISGEPIDEPVASYGPFVMNSQDELKQAFDDFRAGRMGRLPVS